MILRESRETGVDLEIKQLMGFGALSFFVLFIGLVLLNYSIYSLRRELEEQNRQIDKEVLS